MKIRLAPQFLLVLTCRRAYRQQGQKIGGDYEN
jgi:hypothetical protein